MAFFKKMYAKLLGDDEDTGEAPTKKELPAPPPPMKPAAEDYDHKAGVKTVTNPPSRSIELKIAKLTAFNAQVMEIADHLIAGRPVVLNLEGAPKEATRRIIDFFSGVAYTVQGQLKTIAAGIYIVTPSSVDVSSEALIASASKAQPTPPTTPNDTPGATGGASLYDGF
ncbi:MAG: cell division protein SepF [Clostridia bacterium]|nr:cell division protein SepF [Clostridia bacterium]